ncbi:MAG: Ketol-acid reductoisomerase [Firmicutes bacterium ADurb.Bin467]|nr:MAG: Ketol-acid reductoisomerase [Firmicutes bacterium ADurb.Bin467]
MIAPKGPGALVRQCYIADTGVPSLVAIYQDVMRMNDATAAALASILTLSTILSLAIFLKTSKGKVSIV